MNAAHSVIDNFIDQQEARGIVLDHIQRQALWAVSEGRDVLVSAPTGSGKTMVALGAVELALARSLRCVYTAPIKALSNQKYKELCTTYGDEHIGLLTGDETINRDAQILVVTTEVLRNMLYAADDTLHDLGYVILDEVHYLADPSRGPVWEEIILLLPRHTRLIGLSATISNVDELAQWLHSVRGETELVVSYDRPVPLAQYVCDGRELVSLFDSDDKISIKAADMATSAHNERRVGEAGHRRHDHRRRRQISARDRRRVIFTLQRAQMLPAIEFIFSRKGCDRAVSDLLDADVSLTSPHERKLISNELHELRAELSDADARTIRFDFWAKALTRGFAAHHAGMFPALKELIERLMDQGLLSIVYATGTLALGIDMPVRTVVLEELRRFDGTDFVDLTATEYTQLIGRAGRRGKDTVGNAVILATPELSLERLAKLGSGKLEPLKSAFFPSYNAVANLLAQLSYGQSRAIMATSFAQFQANREIVAMEARAGRIRARVREIEKSLEHECEHGSVVEYARLRDRAGRASKSARKKAKAAYKEAITRSWHRAATGHAYAYALNGRLRYGVVLSVHSDRLRVCTLDGDLAWLRRNDLTSELRDLGTVMMPFGMSLKHPAIREQIADELFELSADRIDMRTDSDLQGSWDRGAEPKNPALSAHPVHTCPDLAHHLHRTRELITLDQTLRALDHSSEQATDSVAHEFDATASILSYLGYLQRMPDDPRHADMTWVKLSGGATLLSGIHNESDLLITMCLNEASFGELSPAQFAGICTCFLGDRRLGEAPGHFFGNVADAWHSIKRNYEYLQGLERQAHITRTPEPLGGGVEVFSAWASGAPLSEILRTFKLDVGDFMSAHRRLADLLGQIAAASADSPLASTATQALQSIRRWEWL